MVAIEINEYVSEKLVTDYSACIAYTEIGLNIGKIVLTFMLNFSPVKATDTMFDFRTPETAIQCLIET